MLRAMDRLDQLVAATRPTWGWLGELAVVVLGIHLAADRLDDLLVTGIVALGLPWPDPNTPLVVATWTAVGVELALSVWIAALLLAARAEPASSACAWWDRCSARGVLAPLLFASAGIAGVWVVQMAVEDLVAPVLQGGSAVLAWVLALLVAWRFLWPGLVRLVRRMPRAPRLLAGIGWAPMVLVVALLAVRHGWPVQVVRAWGWLP